MVIHWVAQQDTFLFEGISLDWIGMMLMYLILCCAVVFLGKPRFKVLFMLFLSIILFQLWNFGQVYHTNQKDSLIVLQQIANTVLLHQRGTNLTVMSSHTESAKSMVSDYMIGERIKHHKNLTLSPGYRISSEYLFVVDSMGIYPPANKTSPILLVTQSPKINMERFLDLVQPKQVIADGSNYSSYVQRWKKTCLEKKIPFYATSENGAFALNLNQ